MFDVIFNEKNIVSGFFNLDLCDDKNISKLDNQFAFLAAVTSIKYYKKMHLLQNLRKYREQIITFILKQDKHLIDLFILKLLQQSQMVLWNLEWLLVVLLKQGVQFNNKQLKCMLVQAHCKQDLMLLEILAMQGFLNLNYNINKYWDICLICTLGLQLFATLISSPLVNLIFTKKTLK